MSRKKRGRRLEERNYLFVEEMEREELGKLKYNFFYIFLYEFFGQFVTLCSI